MSLTIKNYKQLEGWAHNYKDLRVGVIYETSLLYSFNVAYNSTPYTIKIFRNGTDISKEYEIVVRDGMDMIQYGRQWIKKDKIEINKITDTFEKLIVSSKPKAQQTTGNINFNNPF
jgi:hypothetical protein